jgi:5'-nucleotidase
MIIKKQNDIFNGLDLSNIYIVTDFDGTLTVSSSDSSWASIFKNPNVSKEFVQECIRIFNKYHPLEIDESIPFEQKLEIMSEWYKVNIDTLIDYAIDEETINYSAYNEKIMCFRDGAKQFLELLNQNGVPVIIISAGVGNIIEQFLVKNQCNFPNVFICSNFLEYVDGKIIGVRNGNLIHSLNKNEVSLPEQIKEKIKNRIPILLGDNIMDINMVDSDKSVVKIGFLDEKVEERMATFLDNFDLVCTENTSYDELFEYISKKVKRK